MREQLCAKCPMREERYETSNQTDKRTIGDLRIAMSRKDDFVEWLFEHSEHCDHIPYSEAWEEFLKWEDSQLTVETEDEVKPKN